MMKAAMEGLTAGGEKRPILLAVTILTSIDEESLHGDMLIGASVKDTVIHYAKNAADSGLDGVVCSPLEAATVHEACGSGFLTVTPGVRFADGDVGDQKRIMTPADANRAGSDYIVVGRPITAAKDPEAAYRRCIEEFTSDIIA